MPKKCDVQIVQGGESTWFSVVTDTKGRVKALTWRRSTPPAEAEVRETLREEPHLFRPFDQARMEYV